MPQLLELRIHCYLFLVYQENHLLLSINFSTHLFLTVVMSSVTKPQQIISRKWSSVDYIMKF